MGAGRRSGGRGGRCWECGKCAGQRGKRSQAGCINISISAGKGRQRCGQARQCAGAVSRPL